MDELQEMKNKDAQAMPELLPCPFCGGSEIEICHTSLYWGQCGNFDCGANTGGEETPELAIAQWNARATPQEPCADGVLSEDVQRAVDTIPAKSEWEEAEICRWFDKNRYTILTCLHNSTAQPAQKAEEVEHSDHFTGVSKMVPAIEPKAAVDAVNAIRSGMETYGYPEKTVINGHFETILAYLRQSSTAKEKVGE